LLQTQQVMTGNFLIQAGHHYCSPRYPYLFYGSEMSRVVRFDRSCIYKGLPDGKEPVNKLFGFAEVWPSVFRHQWGRPLHHLASARFGWNCDELGQLWLYGYSYADGVRETVQICPALPDIDYHCKIVVKNDTVYGSRYIFNIVAGLFDGIETTRRSHTGNRAFGYGLFPYFGGLSSPAPHTMRIDISRP
jgi:hypothetical protein